MICVSCLDLAEQTRREANGVAYRAVVERGTAAAATARCHELEGLAAAWDVLSTTHITASHERYLADIEDLTC